MGRFAVINEPASHQQGRAMRLALSALVLNAAIALGIGVTFSINYWGYPWSLPSLDSRVNEVRWTSMGSFASIEDGTRWIREPPDQLERYRTEPASDFECCQSGRIREVARSQQPSLEAPPQAEVSKLEAEVLSAVTLERGEPRYAYARRLRGVLALGVDAAGRSVAFASFTGGEVSNDHHPMYEVFLQRGAPPVLISSRKYYGDVAGIEGFSAKWVSLFVFVPSALLTAFVFACLGLARKAAVALRARLSTRTG